MNLNKYEPIYSTEPFSNEQTSILFYKRIYSLYKYIQTQIKENETIIPLIHLNDGTTIIVDYFGTYDPNMIIVSGKNIYNEEVFLILHLNCVQINFTIKKLEENKEKHQLGFEI